MFVREAPPSAHRECPVERTRDGTGLVTKAGARAERRSGYAVGFANRTRFRYSSEVKTFWCHTARGGGPRAGVQSPRDSHLLCRSTAVRRRDSDASPRPPPLSESWRRRGVETAPGPVCSSRTSRVETRLRGAADALLTGPVSTVDGAGHRRGTPARPSRPSRGDRHRRQNSHIYVKWLYS